MFDSLTFYAVIVNDHDSSFCASASEALAEIEMHIDDFDEDSYGIERINGVWQLIKRFGALEDYSDDWMQEVLVIVHEMIQEVKKREAERQLKKID
jgi:hypothetical protein